MLTRDQLREHAENIDNVDQQVELFFALEKAKKKLHLDVWDAVTDNPSSIRVESRGRAVYGRPKTPDGPIEYRLEREEKEGFCIDPKTQETVTEITVHYYIRTDLSWEGHILISSMINSSSILTVIML